MSISTTAEYLKILDEIAEIIDKKHLTIDEIRVLNVKKLAVRNFEMQEVKKYPAVLSLVDDFQKNKFFLN
ncbi:MAG: hypothetical protein CMD18_04920 [Flavobacteriales bacterium]|nr:hypothetical protein [Flavobacteriales bacterium]